MVLMPIRPVPPVTRTKSPDILICCLEFWTEKYRMTNIKDTYTP